MYQLLRNLTVIEGASFIAAPSCGLYFAQLGAEVIRFDTIGGGADFGRWPKDQSGHSLYWVTCVRIFSTNLGWSRPHKHPPSVLTGVFYWFRGQVGYPHGAACSARRPHVQHPPTLFWGHA